MNILNFYGWFVGI